jgi:hypothetical protein
MGIFAHELGATLASLYASSSKTDLVEVDFISQ